MKVLLFNNRDNNSMSPIWWNNYVMGSNNLYSSIDTINESLKEYGANFVVTFDDQGFTDERWLSFEHEYQYTWFILRWG